MSDALPKDDNTKIELTENLAKVLAEQSLTHLEYKDESVHIVLKKEQPSVAEALPMLMQGSNGFLPDANSANSANRDAVASELPGTNQSSGGGTKNEAANTAQAQQLGTSITAPLVGIAYSAKEPGAAAFVSVGDKVSEGTVLCLIEAMKMFNEVKAPFSGTITQVLFEDGKLVEFGEQLFSLEKQSS